MFYKLKPAYKDYLWGGVRLKNEYNKVSDLDIIAESWELSTHKDGKSILVDSNTELKDVPILIKYIDALKSLSIQVHPSDEYAIEHEHDLGKTEMWYILEALPNSFLYYGFNQDVTKQQFRKAVDDGTVLDLFNKVYVKKGDHILVKSGTIHAIGEGIVLLEVQESSNSTYRVYDFGRVDAQGNTRPLHLDKACDVINFNKTLIPSLDKKLIEDNSNYSESILDECKYFKAHEIEVKDSYSVPINKDSFTCLNIIEGSGIISNKDKSINFVKGDSYYIEPNTEVNLKGKCKIVKSTLK